MTLELWGIAEAARALGVNQATVRRWSRSDPTFPAPAAELTAGKVYLAAEVRSWRRRQIAARRRRRAF